VGNPFSNIGRSFRAGATAQVNPELYKRRQVATDAEAIRQALEPNIALLPPALQALVKDQAGFAGAMQNPGAFANVGNAATNASPKPADPAKPISSRYSITGDTALGKHFGLSPGQQGLLEETVDPTTGAVINRSLVSYSAQNTDQQFSDFSRVVTADDPLGQELKLPPGTYARVTERKDASGAVVGRKIDQVSDLADIGPGGEEGGPFGNSLQGRALNNLFQFVPEERRQEALRVMSEAVAGQPTVTTDPVTGAPTTRQLDMAPIMHLLSGKPTPSPSGAAATAPQAQPTTAPGAAPEGEPGDAFQANLDAASAALNGRTLFDQAGEVTGLVPAIQRALAGGPFEIFGSAFVGEPTPAADAANFVTELLVDAMRTEREGSSRAVQEVEQIKRDFGMQPEVFSNLVERRTRLANTDLQLQRREQEILARIQNPKSTTRDQKKRDLDALVRIQSVRPLLSPPAVRTEDIEAFIADNPDGTPFVIPDPSNPSQWIRVEVDKSEQP